MFSAQGDPTGTDHRDSGHDGQGVPEDARESGAHRPVSSGGDAAFYSSSHGRPRHPVRPRASGGRLRQGKLCGRQGLRQGSQRTASLQLGEFTQRPQVSCMSLELAHRNRN